jgi:hypothetical protein
LIEEIGHSVDTVLNTADAIGAAGSGFIENLANLSGSKILGQYNSVRSDFNGDKKADILWRNDNGSTNIWQMNGVSVLAANPTNIIVDNSWKIVAPIL